jgi:eukaryotic-like serine/threonine-protein kinase
MTDTEFLALLVHRGSLAREDAERLLPELARGAPLDRLLASELGWSAEEVARLRRTRAGEVPEIPGYEIQGSLGRGGTAEVFRAREKKTGAVFALKVLGAAGTRDEATRRAFVEEARMLEKLAHPGLVKGYGVARSGTTYFSRLECIEGRTLLEWLDDGQLFDEPVALRIVLAVAEVLDYLASNSVIHRDVKPGNLMLDEDGRIKLIDLGFAALAGTQCASGAAIGTKEYLPPEQALGGGAADMRSDIYSLGVTLFQLVVGRLPFEGSTDQEILRKHVTEALSSPELKGRGISPHLHYFVQKMMAKEAGVRYQSWTELVRDVEAQLAGRASLDFGAREAEPRPKSKAPRRRRF